MTKSEEKTIQSLHEVLAAIRKENSEFRELLAARVNGLQDQVEKKHVPINLENEIMQAVDKSISKALAEAMTGYNSPLVKYAQNVVQKYQSQIEGIFSDVIQEAIQTDDFRQRVREVLLNKIAKTMIAGVDGSIDKTINLMKQDAIFRSRLTLSVNGLVDEFLNQKPS